MTEAETFDAETLDTETLDGAGPSPYDHVAGDGDALSPGTFRVVGVDDGEVTLLRVTDARGRRVNAGELASVPRDAFASLESAANPDAERPLTTWGLLVLGGLVLAASASPPVVAATGLSADAVSAAGAAVLVVGLVRVLRARR